ncbi:TIGR03862 family flavoprotein [Robbsia sp. Bb-Pol-6]|uniref:TIGR03862 family flavoprotein n=1 Tax=Robbsia betulipollinis TaxID=2981849 RepID=A0ABT3ZS18_9BURK|nr:TIGR03862 family flavoprotein [Robbsia betulipollinis]MCY0388730.1 TIGR03862 family flavoprotein [Robbsia betulipollinis]
MANEAETAPPHVAVIGAGPAGLMAAERLAGTGVRVSVYDAMPSAGRKFLMAGKGGMNLTHSEPPPAFTARYGIRRERIAPLLDAFPPAALRAWVHALGIETFVGSSGRVFPADMKAAPLLRAWLQRLRGQGVTLHMRHRWLPSPAGDGDVDSGPAASPPRRTLRFMTPDGERTQTVDALVLALGGASWPRLGSDAAWVPALRDAGLPIADFRPANGGFEADWTPFFATRFAGQPLKTVALAMAEGQEPSDIEQAGTEARFRRGECMVSATGLEGGLIYAFSAAIRDRIERDGRAVIQLDLLPNHTPERVREALARPRGKRSLGSHLQSTLGLTGVKTALLHECLSKDTLLDPHRLAAAIKALPVTLHRPRPIAEAISSAGGVAFEALDAALMVVDHPGLFCAGEMLDWEAPTGGYLLSACFASGQVAGDGARAYLANRTPAPSRQSEVSSAERA